MSLFLKARQTIQNAGNDDCCGVWPLQWCSDKFIFQICCQYHDIWYLELRADYIAMKPRPHIRTMKDRVLRKDKNFYKCLDNQLKDRPWYVTLWARPIKSSFKKIVETFGWSIWVSKTRIAIRELR